MTNSSLIYSTDSTNSLIPSTDPTVTEPYPSSSYRKLSYTKSLPYKMSSSDTSAETLLPPPSTRTMMMSSPPSSSFSSSTGIQRILQNITSNPSFSSTLKEYCTSLLTSHRFLPEHSDCLNYLAPSSKCTKDRSCGLRHNFTLYKLVKENIVKPYELPRCVSWLQRGDCSDGPTCMHYHPSLDLLPYIPDANSILNQVPDDTGSSRDINPLNLRTLPVTVPRDINSVSMNATEVATFHIFWDTENCSLPWAASPTSYPSSSTPDNSFPLQQQQQQQQPVIASGAEVMAALEQVLRVITGYQKVSLNINAFHRQNLPSAAKISLQFVGVKLHDCGNKGGAVDTGIFNALLDFVLNKRIEQSNDTLNHNHPSSSANNHASNNVLSTSLRSTSPSHRPLTANGTVPKEWVVLISGDRDFRGIQSIREKLNIPTILFHGPNIHSDLHFICDTFVPWSLVTNHANFTKYVKMYPNVLHNHHHQPSQQHHPSQNYTHGTGSSQLRTGSNESMNGGVTGEGIGSMNGSHRGNVSTITAPSSSMTPSGVPKKQHNVPIVLKFKNDIILDPTITFTATRLMSKDLQNYERNGVPPTRVRKACRVCAFFLGEKCTKGDMCGFLHPCPAWDFERMEGCGKGDLCPYDHILPMRNIAPSMNTNTYNNGSSGNGSVMGSTVAPPGPPLLNYGPTSTAGNTKGRLIPSGPRGDTSFLTRAVVPPSGSNGRVRFSTSPAIADNGNISADTTPSTVANNGSTINSNTLLSRSSSLSNPSALISRTNSDRSSDEETRDVTNEETGTFPNLSNTESSAASSLPHEGSSLPLDTSSSFVPAMETLSLTNDSTKTDTSVLPTFYPPRTTSGVSRTTSGFSWDENPSSPLSDTVPFQRMSGTEANRTNHARGRLVPPPRVATVNLSDSIKYVIKQQYHSTSMDHMGGSGSNSSGASPWSSSILDHTLAEGTNMNRDKDANFTKSRSHGDYIENIHDFASDSYGSMDHGEEMLQYDDGTHPVPRWNNTYTFSPPSRTHSALVGPMLSRKNNHRKPFQSSVPNPSTQPPLPTQYSGSLNQRNDSNGSNTYSSDTGLLQRSRSNEFVQRISSKESTLPVPTMNVDTNISGMKQTNGGEGIDSLPMNGIENPDKDVSIPTHSGSNEEDVDDVDLNAMLKMRTNSNNSGKISNVNKSVPLPTNVRSIINDIPSKYTNHSSAPNSNIYDRNNATQSKKLPVRKTVLCRHFQRTGYCARGNACGFAHGEAELYIPPQQSSGPSSQPPVHMSR